jgi:hypothetical protein
MVVIHLLTYSMEQSPPCESNWFSTSQEIPTHFKVSENSSTEFASLEYKGASQSAKINTIKQDSQQVIIYYRTKKCDRRLHFSTI